MEYINIIKALKDAGHNVDEQNFSNKMSDPKFVEKVRSALELEGHIVPDSSTFYSKYVNKEVQQQIQQPNKPPVSQQVPEESFEEMLYRKVPGSKESLEMILPRTYSDEFQNRSTGANIANLGKDILSFPGRIIATGAQVAGDIAGGDTENIADKLYKGLISTGSSESGLKSIPDEIVRSPYSALPTGNIGSLAKGLGEVVPIAAPLVSKALPVLTSPIAKVVEPVVRYGTEGAGIQAVENVAGDRKVGEDLGKGFLRGAIFGAIPGVANLPKLKNELAVASLIDNSKAGHELAEKGYRYSDELLNTLDDLAKGYNIKLPKTKIDRLTAIPKIVDEIRAKEGMAGRQLKPEMEQLLTKLKSGNLDLGKLSPVKGLVPDWIDIGLLATPLGVKGVIAKQLGQQAFKKTPQIERTLENPLSQGLGKFYQPYSRTAQQDSIKNKNY